MLNARRNPRIKIFRQSICCRSFFNTLNIEIKNHSNHINTPYFVSCAIAKLGLYHQQAGRVFYKFPKQCKKIGEFQLRGCSSVVEHNLAKVGVVGSNPITRSNFQVPRSVDRDPSDCFQTINVLEQEFDVLWCG